MAKEAEQLYVVNMDFDGGQLGEVITALPSTVEDWEEAQFISRIDENGERLVVVGARGKLGTDPGAEPFDASSPRPVDTTDPATQQ